MSVTAASSWLLVFWSNRDSSITATSPSYRSFTDGAVISSRVIFRLRGVGESGLRTSTVTSVPASPRICLATSSTVWPSVGLPFTPTIRSPALIPARSAGEPSIGAITVTCSSRNPISMPIPVTLPSSVVCSSAASSLVRNTLYGSFRPLTNPLVAPVARSS